MTALCETAAAVRSPDLCCRGAGAAGGPERGDLGPALTPSRTRLQPEGVRRASDGPAPSLSAPRAAASSVISKGETHPPARSSGCRALRWREAHSGLPGHLGAGHRYCSSFEDRPGEGRRRVCHRAPSAQLASPRTQWPRVPPRAQPREEGPGARQGSLSLSFGGNLPESWSPHAGFGEGQALEASTWLSTPMPTSVLRSQVLAWE